MPIKGTVQTRRPRQKNVYIVRHRESGLYSVAINESTSYNINAHVKNINEMAKWGRNRKVMNYPIKDFADRFAPVTVNCFEVTRVAEGFFTYDEGVGLAASEVKRLGAHLLMTSGIIPKSEWSLLGESRARVTARQFVDPKTSARDPSISAFKALELAGHSVVISGFTFDGHMSTENLLMAGLMYQDACIITRDHAYASARCNSEHRVTFVLCKVQLKMKRSEWREPVTTEVTFGHYGPFMEDTVAEFEKLLAGTINNHTPTSVYSTYF